MDLSEIIVVALGILLFFGGAVWLEIRARKQNHTDQQDVQPLQPTDLTTSAGRTVNRRIAESE
jgi:PBP1b-binding outer membrane lipoprotein LpoB